MTVSGKSDYQVIADALDHFAKVLRELQDDDEVKIGNGAMKQDVEDNAKKASDLAIMVRSKNHDLKFIHNLVLVCNALAKYSKDMQASRDSLKIKLFGEHSKDVAFDTANLDKEIAHVELLFGHYCKLPPDS